MSHSYVFVSDVEDGKKYLRLTAVGDELHIAVVVRNEMHEADTYEIIWDQDLDGHEGYAEVVVDAAALYHAVNAVL